MRPGALIRKMAEETGAPGFHWEGDRHALTYVRRSPRLVVTFDNMKSRDMPAPREPWGYGFLEELGVSHMAVMMRRRNDWFRHWQLWNLFDRFRKINFFDQFRDVVFYGSSMGAYGACAFSSSVPGSRVVALVPQSTLFPDLVPWETRFRNGFERGHWGRPRYRDAAAEVASASKVQIFYDPYYRLDRLHADRFTTPNVEHFACPFMGHKVPRLLLHMGVLKQAMTDGINGTLTQADFYRRLRARQSNLGYVRALVGQALERERPDLALHVLNATARDHPDWTMPSLRKQVKAAMVQVEIAA